MRESYTWGGNDGGVNYDLILENGTVKNYNKEDCYSRLRDSNAKIDKIRLYTLDCKLTIEYRNWFLQYLIDMLALDANFNDEYFEYKNTGSNRKNMLVAALTRLLWEQMFNKQNSDNVSWILKPLKEGKSKYRNKLARFCDFYSKIPCNEQYLHDGHLWRPDKTIIKYTKDFTSSVKISTVNGFFTQ